MRFEELSLSEQTRNAVADMGFTEMTEVQEKTIPEMMENRDVIAKAPTGTGKTCAFGIPILERIDEESDALQCLILSPTRELTSQIAEELRFGKTQAQCENCQHLRRAGHGLGR
ncbi:MAG: DEAD/DEAH box helicase [Christensenellales bacterium]